MNLYCRIKRKKNGIDRVTAFTSKQKNPSTLALSSRALKTKLTQNFKNDQDLRDAVGLMNSCILYDFDRVYKWGSG